MAKEGEYQLDVLLELRQKEREDAEGRYAEVLSGYHRAGETVRRAQEKHRLLVEERRQKTREFDQAAALEATEMAAMQGFDFYLEGLLDQEGRVLEELEQAREEQLQAQRRMRSAHQEMLGAIKALQAVEKHFESWQREQRQIAQRKEANRMDDVAARIWREQRS